MLLCKDITSVQAKRITTDYVGKWISVEGKLENVMEGLEGRHSVMLEIPRDRFSSTIYLDFGRPEPILEHLQIGAPVKAIGRIERIRELSMELLEAELV